MPSSSNFKLQDPQIRGNCFYFLSEHNAVILKGRSGYEHDGKDRVITMTRRKA